GRRRSTCGARCPLRVRDGLWRQRHDPRSSECRADCAQTRKRSERVRAACRSAEAAGRLMTIRNLAHEALRTATADCHRRVDQIYSAARLSERLAYGNFLRAQAAACLPLEASLERAGVAGVVEDWPERVRGLLILADLAELEIEKPALAEAPAMTSAPAMLGAL